MGWSNSNSWGDSQEGWYKVPAAALSPVTLTYQTSGIGGTGTNTNTFGTITIGAAPSANRRIIVAWNGPDYNSSNPVVGTPVFTPNAGSPINADTVIQAGIDSVTQTGLGLISAILPVGTTTTLTVTFTGATFNSPRFAVYTVDNSTLSNPTTPTHAFTQSTTSPISASIATPAGSGLIADFWGFGASTAGWTAGVTSDIGGGSAWDFGHISNASASASYTVTNTWTVSGSGNPDIALWVYR